MMTTDPIADLLTRIRNAVRARKSTCEIPASTIKESVLKVFKEKGFIAGYVRQQEEVQDTLIVQLKYLGKNHKSVINSMKRVSKPGRRIYKGYRDMKPLLSGLGYSILSTPKGIMTDEDARKHKLGGELLCEVW